MTSLYVGNLDYGVSDEDLKDLFKEFGEIHSAKVIIDRETRRSRGFGFVEFDDDEEAQAAIEDLDGANYKGRALKVNVAKPREERSPQRKASKRR